MPSMAAIFHGIMDIVRHFISGIGDEILSFARLTLVHEINGDAGGKGGGKCS